MRKKKKMSGATPRVNHPEGLLLRDTPPSPVHNNITNHKSKDERIRAVSIVIHMIR